MRILYGVQGTGNGHISRCRLMAKALQAEGVQVDYVLSGRDADAYFDMQAFGEYRCLPGLSFATKDGAIDLWATVNRSQPLQLLRDIRQLSLDDYDLIISDFEPVTAWAAKRQNRPVLGIRNDLWKISFGVACRTLQNCHEGRCNQTRLRLSFGKHIALCWALNCDSELIASWYALKQPRPT